MLKKSKKVIERKERVVEVQEETVYSFWSSNFMTFFKRPYSLRPREVKELRIFIDQNTCYKDLLVYWFSHWDDFKSELSWITDMTPSPGLLARFGSRILDWYYSKNKIIEETSLPKVNLTEQGLDTKIRLERLIEAESKVVEMYNKFNQYRDTELAKLRQEWKELGEAKKCI